MLKVMHICIAPHLLWIERENLEGPSLLRVQQALPVVVIGLGAAVSFLLWRLSAAAVSGDSSQAGSRG